MALDGIWKENHRETTKQPIWGHHKETNPKVEEGPFSHLISDQREHMQDMRQYSPDKPEQGVGSFHEGKSRIGKQGKLRSDTCSLFRLCRVKISAAGSAQKFTCMRLRKRARCHSDASNSDHAHPISRSQLAKCYACHEIFSALKFAQGVLVERPTA